MTRDYSKGKIYMIEPMKKERFIMGAQYKNIYQPNLLGILKTIKCGCMENTT